MAKHYAKKMNDTAEKVEYLSTIENALMAIEDMDFSYLSTVEQNKLTTICSKLHTFINDVSFRMDGDIKNITIKSENKEKLKEVNKKLKSLSPEKFDKLLSTL